MQHVKAHGALYNLAVKNAAVAEAIAAAVRQADPDLLFFVLPGSALEVAGEEAGLPVVREAFADRAYNPDGTLASRQLPGSVITDPAEVAARAVRMAVEGRVTALDGREIELAPDTLCIHGDTPGAPDLARRVRAALEEHGVAVRPLAEVVGSRQSGVGR